MTILRAVIRGLTEFNRIRRLNRLSVTLRFCLMWMLNAKGMARLNVFGEYITLRYRYSDWKTAYNSLGAEFDPIVDNFFVDDGALIIDAGGFIGTAAIRLARAYPRAKVVSLEPSLENFRLLCVNVSGISNIEPINAALTTSCGTGRLRSRGSGDWGFTLVPDVSADEGEEVKTISFAEVLRRFGQSRVAIFKVDIEGTEDLLLRESELWLDYADILFIELHERIVPGVTTRFRVATNGRLNLKLTGEKILSLSPNALARCLDPRSRKDEKYR